MWKIAIPKRKKNIPKIRKQQSTITSLVLKIRPAEMIVVQCLYLRDNCTLIRTCVVKKLNCNMYSTYIGEGYFKKLSKNEK